MLAWGRVPFTGGNATTGPLIASPYVLHESIG